ncbi:MAG: high-affinity zinc transporter periplasmic component [Methanosaeta sp. PtaU1.Bin112]|nr:MAG: high-affinity zinc transporter periplasmic component [Methanosaeta sp. PtaU1.Bin112]
MKDTFIFVPLFILLMVAVAFSGCISQDESSISSQSGNASHKINVATTISPLEHFVRIVGGEKVSVTVVVPPGAEPHTFEPTPSLMMDLSKADLYIMNGAGLEFWMDKLLGANKKLVVVDTSQGISLQAESEDEMDPHIWLSLRNAALQVQSICRGLSEVDPQNKDYYAKNRDDYMQKLKALDEELNRTFAGKKNKTFIVHHPAWTYFARDYELLQVPLMENEKEPGPKYLGEVIEMAKKDNITTIFVEPEFNPKSAEVIAGEMNAQIVVIDPLAADYLDNMINASREIALSLP